MKKAVLLIIITLGALALFSGCSQTVPRSNSPAPDFMLPDLNGQSVSLSALRGRPVLLNFWATWCGPCRSEMPYLQELQMDPAWRERGLLILAVNLQEPETTVSKFMADNGFSFTVLLDARGEAGRLYNVASIPATYIIGKDGIIKNSRVGAFANKAQIGQMLTSALSED
jgi:cytochrome c biogenesis protein CcmG/thiol:disulfide interchange protein DsbE